MASGIFKEIEKGNLSGAKRCLSLYPASASTKNSAGATPLHVAASLGLAPFVKELLVHSAPHDAADSQGNLPLHLAAQQGSLEGVLELLTGPGRKLAVKAKNKDGQTPLHLAVRNGHTAIAARLLEAGARTDAKDKSGNTPLDLVSTDDEEMLQLLLTSTSTSSLGSASLGLGVSAAVRGHHESSLSTYRASPSAGGASSSASGSATSRIAGTPPPPAAAAPAAGTPLSARTPPPVPPLSIPGSTTSRLPRNSAGASGVAQQSGGGNGGGAGSAVGPNSTATAGPTLAAQLQKHEASLQALQAELRATTERLSTVDAIANAQLECSSQMEKTLGACGNNSQLISELEARVSFQEDRARDTRSRVERLEEGERSMQDSMSRLTSDHRNLHTQLRDVSEQLAALRVVRMTGSGDTGVAATAAHQQLQAELAGLRAQVEVLSPVMMVASSASAEARSLSVRLDALQQQVQQSQLHHQQQAGSAALEQQVLQLQAQVQLLQLPVATLTQQCGEMSSKLGAVTEWQQQARADLEKLAEAAAAAQAGKGAGGGTGASGSELSEAVMRVLDTTARTMAELRQQQDATARQVAELLQQQHAAAPSTPLHPGTPGLPSTPNGAHQHRSSGGGDSGAGVFGGPPSRHLAGFHSGGGTAREAATQAEMRAELEALKELVAEVRKEVATEGGSLRRDWQRAFSEMQSRYGEQANELQRREQNIAKLREATLVEEAERRAIVGFEDKVSKRLTKLETGLEYLQHRLEVVEEQVQSMAATLTGANSPAFVLSPTARAAAAAVAARGQQNSSGPSASGPGPVSENHGKSVATASHLAIAAASVASSPLAQGKAGLMAGAQASLPTAAALSCVGGGPLLGEVRLPHAQGSSRTAQGQGGPGVASGRPQPPSTACSAIVLEAAAHGGLTAEPVAPGPALRSGPVSGFANPPAPSAADSPMQQLLYSSTGPPAPHPSASTGPWNAVGALGVDPASVMLGPQLLPATAQAFLAPSMDIQRVAAAQQQQQGQHYPATGQQCMPPLLRHNQQQTALGLAAGSVVPQQPTGSVGPLENATATTTATQVSGQGNRRKEPPMCLYCSVQ